MKKTYILLAFILLIVSVSYAMGSAPEPKVKGPGKKISKVLINEYGITQKQVDHLFKRGYTMDDVFYLSLLAKESNKDVNTVAALHAKGVGWGVLAKKLGVHPKVLNRFRVKLNKTKKAALREQKAIKVKENNKFKIKAIKAPRVKPMKGGGGKKN